MVSECIVGLGRILGHQLVGWPAMHLLEDRTVLGIGNGVGKQGSRQSTPLSTIRTRYGNSVSTPGATRTGKSKQNSEQNGSRYGISVSTPHRRYGHRLRTPFLRTPFPRLLVTLKLSVQQRGSQGSCLSGGCKVPTERVFPFICRFL